MKSKREKYGFILIVLAGVFTLLAFLFSERVPQDIRYHGFSDTETYICIPNALNVLSNIPFLAVGILGLLSFFRNRSHSPNIVESNILAYFVLFLGTALVGVGSSYYHLWPSNETLVWDRLPMTFAFMGLYSIIVSEFISETKGKLLLLPLLCAGVFSVLYWWYTESRGVGDLRYYAVVQFFPILTIPVILLFFKSKYCSVSGYWVLLGTYVAAKLFEHFDAQIHEVLLVVSGHSIKHILPALGLFILLNKYKAKENT